MISPGWVSNTPRRRFIPTCIISTSARSFITSKKRRIRACFTTSPPASLSIGEPPRASRRLPDGVARAAFSARCRGAAHSSRLYRASNRVTTQALPRPVATLLQKTRRSSHAHPGDRRRAGTGPACEPRAGPARALGRHAARRGRRLASRAPAIARSARPRSQSARTRRLLRAGRPAPGPLGGPGAHPHRSRRSGASHPGLERRRGRLPRKAVLHGRTRRARGSAGPARGHAERRPTCSRSPICTWTSSGGA